jgi:hypothetical protein
MAVEATKQELEERQREKRRRAGLADASTSTLRSLGAAIENANHQSADDEHARNRSTAQPIDVPTSPAGANSTLTPGANSAIIASLSPSESRSAPPDGTPNRRPETIRQGLTYLSADFEMLQDIVYALERKYKIKNPLGAKLGPSHVAGALIHHLLPTWNSDPAAIVAIVEGFLREWATPD